MYITCSAASCDCSTARFTWFQRGVLVNKIACQFMSLNLGAWAPEMVWKTCYKLILVMGHLCEKYFPSWLKFPCTCKACKSYMYTYVYRERDRLCHHSFLHNKSVQIILYLLRHGCAFDKVMMLVFVTHYKGVKTELRLRNSSNGNSHKPMANSQDT